MRPLLLLLLFPALLVADPMRRDRYGDPLPEGAIQRLGTARMQHFGATRLTVAPDGKTLITRGNGHLRIWSAANGKLLRSLPYPSQAGRFYPFFSEDARRFVDIERQVIRVWDVESQTILKRLPLKGVDRLSAVAFSRDGNRIATAEDTPREYRLRIWNLKDGSHEEIGHTETRIVACNFVSPSVLVSIAESDEEKQSLQIWNLDDPKENRFLADTNFVTEMTTDDPWLRLRAPSRRIRNLLTNEEFTLDSDDIYFSPDGRKRFSSDGEKSDLITETGQFWIRPLWYVWRRQVKARFAPDSSWLAVMHHNGKLGVYSCRDGKPIWVASSDPSDEITAVDWFPDSRRLNIIYGKSNRSNCLYDFDSGELTAWGEFESTLSTMIFAKDRPYLLSYKHRLTRRDPKNNDPIKFAPHEPPVRLIAPKANDPHLREVYSMQMERDTKLVGDDLKSFRVVHEQFLKGIKLTGLGHQDSEFSRDARFFVAGGELIFPFSGESLPEREEQEKLFGLTLSERTDLIAGLVSREVFTPPEGAKEDLRFEFDLRIWERQTGRTLLTIPNRKPMQRAFHPSGQFLATDHRDGIRIWNLRNGNVQQFIPVHDPCLVDLLENYATLLRFSPDGSKLASGHTDTTVLIWDTSDLPKFPREKLDEATLNQLFAQLREPDAATAQKAIWRLSASPETALPFLIRKLKPIQKLPPETTEPILKQLRSEQFRVREAAMKKLNELDDGLLASLESWLKLDLDEDLRKRLQTLPEQRRWSVPPTGEDLRLMRSLRILEAINTPEALKLVEHLASGLPQARATQEAIATRERMKWW
jgi:WD40 repeat protein